MSPAELMEVGKMVILGLGFLIAVTGITVRLALRPGADARARMRGPTEAEHLLEQRVSRIESELERLDELRTTVERLTEELEFQRQLALPAAASPVAGRPHA